MGEKYTNLVGRAHIVKESIREKWASTKEEGGITHTIGTRVDQVKEGVIEKINHGHDQSIYDHLYRLVGNFYQFLTTILRNSQFNLTSSPLPQDLYVQSFIHIIL